MLVKKYLKEEITTISISNYSTYLKESIGLLTALINNNLYDTVPCGLKYMTVNFCVTEDLIFSL